MPASAEPRFFARDEHFMRLALREAERAAEHGDVPIGAVVVRDGELLAAAGNERELRRDPTAHAEMLAIRAAAEALGGWRLPDTTLYVTLEPCAMCAGAIVLARIPRVVFGAADPKAGAAGSVLDVLGEPAQPPAPGGFGAAGRRVRGAAGGVLRRQALAAAPGALESPAMRYRKLGDSDIEVSEISLGSWLTYGAGVEREQTEACTRAAFDAGINFFDTSNVYGSGAAETAWGEVLPDFERDSYVLATKVFFPMTETDRGLSREQIHKQIDASLERLQTDYVDLYQCHRPDPETPIEETMEALTEVCEAGKAREIGFSEWTVEQIEAGLEVPGARKFVSSQPQYNMIWRAPEAELIPFCAEHGISQIVWSPLAQGVLTGKYAPGEPPPVRLARRQRRDGLGDGPLPDRRGARGGPAADADRRGRRAEHGADGARLGPARAERRLGDHRRLAPRAGPLERRGLRASSSRGTRSTRSTRRWATSSSPSPRLANFVQEGVKHR